MNTIYKGHPVLRYKGVQVVALTAMELHELKASFASGDWIALQKAMAVADEICNATFPLLKKQDVTVLRPYALDGDIWICLKHRLAP